MLTLLLLKIRVKGESDQELYPVKNELKEDRNELARLDYRDWLAKTIDELNREAGEKVFCLKTDINSGRFRLIIDIHCFAAQLAKNQELTLPLEKGEKTYKATINMVEKCREVFGEKIQEIKTALSNRLIEAIRKARSSPDGESSEAIVDELIESMLVPLASMPQESNSSHDY